MNIDTYTMYEKIILDGIDFEGYEIEAKNDFEKINELFKVFNSEYGHEILIYGKKRAFAEWLQGLPSSCNVPFYNHDILNRGYIHGYVSADATEDQEQEFLNKWFINLSEAFFTLLENL